MHIFSMQLSWLNRYNFLIFDQIDSTNSEAIRLIRSGITGNFLIWARTQTFGRGRQGNRWESVHGNLYLSILLDTDIPITSQHEVSFITGLALYDAIKDKAIESLKETELHLKWPNDVLIKGQKIAGILLESLSIYNRNYLVVGVGVNVNSSPKNIGQLTTSLFEEKIITDCTELLHIFITYFDKYFNLWNKKGFLIIRKKWLKRAYNLNNLITINDGNNRISGVFKDIDFTGKIRIQTANGQIFTISSGEL